MAFGCNGPELAVNFIAIFITHSEVGVGTIVGSDVFNLLMIAGLSTLAAPKAPIKLDASPLTRDIIFYAISIFLLAYVISDGRVDLWQAAMLSAMTVVYALAVAFWKKLTGSCSRREPEAARERASSDVSEDSSARQLPPEEEQEQVAKKLLET